MNVEVLAPVGNYLMVDEILSSKCDAIYLGGIEFNMRMHSKLLNFTNEEIKKTVVKAHAVNKPVYVTVNTWFDNSEVDLLIEYLKFLDDCNVDAIIVQDYGVIKIVKEYNLSFDIHASVMMNVHTLDQINVLKADGVTRVVLSREMSLSQAHAIALNTEVELEYFVSGDMCSANGGICYYSGVLFGKSANQGKCFKMCRWNYELIYNNQVYKDAYYLAAKDMDLVNHVGDLITSGINSLKIEGRRKQVVDTIDIINSFGQAKENYFNDKVEKFDLTDIYPRSTSTGYAFTKPHLDYINTKNEGNGKAIRIFSTQGKEIKTKPVKYSNISQVVNHKESLQTLTIKVDNYLDGQLALDLKSEKLYLSVEQFSSSFSISQMQDLINNKGETKVYLSMPIMQSEQSNSEVDKILNSLVGLDGIEVSDISHIVKYRDKYEIRCNYTLGCFNDYARDYLKELGATSYSIPIEAKPSQFNDLINTNEDIDVYGYGRLMMMYLDLDLYKNIDPQNIIGETTSDFNEVLVLRNKLKQDNPVYRDQFGKNHLMSNKILNLSPFLKKGNVIIDARFINQDQVKLAVNEFRGNTEFEYRNDEFFGSLNHGYNGRKYVIEK